MTKGIEFNIPTATSVEKARGIPRRFVVGDRVIKFMLQYDRDNKLTLLTHFASGCKFGNLNDAETELMCKLSPYHRFSKRQLAEFLIDKMVFRFGIEKVLATIDAAPVIN